MSRTTGKKNKKQRDNRPNVPGIQGGRQAKNNSGGLNNQAKMTKKPKVSYGPVQITQPKPTITNPLAQAERDVALMYEPQLDAIDQGIRDTQNLGQQRQTA